MRFFKLKFWKLFFPEWSDIQQEYLLYVCDETVYFLCIDLKLDIELPCQCNSLVTLWWQGFVFVLFLFFCRILEVEPVFSYDIFSRGSCNKKKIIIKKIKMSLIFTNTLQVNSLLHKANSLVFVFNPSDSILYFSNTRNWNHSFSLQALILSCVSITHKCYTVE